MPLDPEQLADLVTAAIRSAVAPLAARVQRLEAREPLPGRDGRDGAPGMPGEKGLDGTNGQNGVDGQDGLGFEDLDVAHDGERELTLRFIRGDRVKAFPVTLPIVLDRGIYQPATTYTKGDAVTWGGSLWIAQDTTVGAKPGEGVSSWRLAVKAGRDARSR